MARLVRDCAIDHTAASAAVTAWSAALVDGYVSAGHIPVHSNSSTTDSLARVERADLPQLADSQRGAWAAGAARAGVPPAHAAEAREVADTAPRSRVDPAAALPSTAAPAQLTSGGTRSGGVRTTFLGTTAVLVIVGLAGSAAVAGLMSSEGASTSPPPRAAGGPVARVNPSGAPARRDAQSGELTNQAAETSPGGTSTSAHSGVTSARRAPFVVDLDEVQRVEGGRLTYSSDGSVADRETSLTWERHVVDELRSAAEAHQYCSSLSLLGLTWRLPTTKELLTLVRPVAPPTLSQEAFPGAPSTDFWSDDGRGSGCARVVSFADGQAKYRCEEGLRLHVRCVSGLRLPSDPVAAPPVPPIQESEPAPAPAEPPNSASSMPTAPVRPTADIINEVPF